MLTSGRVWPTPPRSDDSTPRATAATARSRLAQALDFETPAAGADVLPPRPAGEDPLLGLEEDTDPPAAADLRGPGLRVGTCTEWIMARAARVAADNFIGIPLNGRARIGGGNGSGFREVAAALAAGERTAWLWARTEMAGAVDVLVIVEAGQMSRANPSSGSPARRRRLPLAHLLGECVAARDSRVARRRGIRSCPRTTSHGSAAANCSARRVTRSIRSREPFLTTARISPS